MLGAPSSLTLVPMPALCPPAHATAHPCCSTRSTRRHGRRCLGARATCPLAVSSARATGSRFRASSAEPLGELPTAGA
jgi:hypothetical protein